MSSTYLDRVVAVRVASTRLSFIVDPSNRFCALSSYFDTALHLLGPRSSMGPTERGRKAQNGKNVRYDQRESRDWAAIRFVAPLFAQEWEGEDEREREERSNPTETNNLTAHARKKERKEKKRDGRIGRRRMI